MSVLLLMSALIADTRTAELELLWSQETHRSDGVLEFSADGASVWVAGDPKGELPLLVSLSLESGEQSDLEMRFPARVRGIRFYEGGAVSVAGRHVIWWDKSLKTPFVHELEIPIVGLATSADASTVAVICGEINYQLDDDDPMRERGQLVILGSASPGEIKKVVSLGEAPRSVEVSDDGKLILLDMLYKEMPLRVFKSDGDEREVHKSLQLTDSSRVAFIPRTQAVIIGQHRNPKPILRFESFESESPISVAIKATKAITSMDVSNDGKTIATGCLTDGLFGSYYASVELWDAETTEAIASVTTRSFGKPFVETVRFSPDGRHLAVLERDGRLMMYRVVED